MIVMMAALGILLFATFFSNLCVLEAGLDSFTSKKDENTRRTILQKLSQLTGSQEDFGVFKSELLNPFLKVRDMFSPGHGEVQKHIKDHFTSLGWNIEEDAFTDQNTPYGAVNFANIITTPPYPAHKYLVLACHYDSKYLTEGVFVGATDSAVPCAILLDIAKSLNTYLKRYPSSKYGLKMIFFDGEEAFKHWSDADSIYGARHLAAKMENTKVRVSVDRQISQLQQISLFVLLDLIGHKETTFKNLISGTTDEFKKLENIESSLKSYGLLASSNHRYFSSDLVNAGIGDDHVPFAQRGVPVVHLISFPFPAVWHTVQDNESNLDYHTIHDVMKMMRVFVVDYMALNVEN